MSEIEPLVPTDTPQRRSRLLRVGLTLVIMVVLAVAISAIMDTNGYTTFFAIVLGLVILRFGWFFLQQFATPPPPPPEAGKMRKVKLTYRCSICGAEVRMTAAATEDPEPPRHCLEDMDLVAPID